MVFLMDKLLIIIFLIFIIIIYACNLTSIINLFFYWMLPIFIITNKFLETEVQSVNWMSNI